MSFRTAREDRALAQGFVTPGDSPFRIALLHCNVGSATGHAAYAQCELGDLTAAGFDYWALGHVHEHRILSREPWVVYPGNIQGRSVRETGPRGCEVVQVDTDSHHVQSEFVPLDTVRWEVLSLDIAGLETLDQLDAALDQAIENAVAGASGRPLVLRIRCAGAGPLAAVLAADGDEGQGLLQRLRERNGLDREPFLWIERLVIRVRPPIDVAARRQGSDLLAMALRVAEETRCADTAEHRRLREELEALYGHSKAGKVLEDLSDTDIAALIEDAQILCAQLLEPETTTGD
jgi:DNA repair exonuclease SbcCD nuclease subunit